MAKLDLFVDEAREAARLLERKLSDGLYAVVLDEWRGVRLIVDSIWSRQCRNNCQDCPQFDILSNLAPLASVPQSASESVILYEWKAPKDLRLYGPERLLPCKTLERYGECFANCILFDEEMWHEPNLMEELQLVKTFKLVWSTRTGARECRARERHFKRRIINSILDKSLELNLPHQALIEQCVEKMKFASL